MATRTESTKIQTGRHRFRSPAPAPEPRRQRHIDLPAFETIAPDKLAQMITDQVKYPQNLLDPDHPIAHIIQTARGIAELMGTGLTFNLLSIPKGYASFTTFPIDHSHTIATAIAQSLVPEYEPADPSEFAQQLNTQSLLDINSGDQLLFSLSCDHNGGTFRIHTPPIKQPVPQELLDR